MNSTYMVVSEHGYQRLDSSRELALTRWESVGRNAVDA